MERDFDPFIDPDLTPDNFLDGAEMFAFGIDVGGADDTTALTIIAKHSNGYRICGQGFVSRRGYELRRNAVDMSPAIADGSLIVVENIGDDLDLLLAAIERYNARGLPCALGADAYGMKPLQGRLDDLGIAINAVPQGWKIGAWIDSFERELLRGKVRFVPSALLRSHLGNATVQSTDTGMRYFTKPGGLNYSARKIDAAVALLCAFAALSTVRDTAPSLTFLGGDASSVRANVPR